MRAFIRLLKQYQLFYLALVSLLVALGLQFSHQQTIAHWILGVVALGEVLPLLWGMVQDIRSGSYGIDILAATAIVAAVILKQYWAATVVVLMLTGGESLEDYAEHRANSELSALLKQAPRQAHVIRNHKTVDMAASEVKIGDIVIVKPGEVVPVDALITAGSGSFNEASLTGESVPAFKESGGLILSGTINLDEAITAKAQATAQNSQYEQIIKLVRAAAKSQSPFVRLADRYSIPFTIIAYAIAAIAWAFSGHAIRFLEVIIVATPCPLLLAAPIALISGMSRASKHGVIVKTGSALERLAEAQTFAFDKTGTLTEGKLSLSSVETFNGYTKDKVLALAAGLEQVSNHIVAHAIVTAAQSKKLKLVRPKRLQEIAGQGLEGLIKGDKVLIGRRKLLENREVTFPSNFHDTAKAATAAYVAVNQELAGIILLNDTIRTNSLATLDYLREHGHQDILLITGDSPGIAKAIGKQLGIDQVHAETLPADKLHLVEGVSRRPVVFIGDGVNDAPVLTVADVGIALGTHGSTVASESADMVIIPDDISYVTRAVSIAKRTFRIARQSILVGIGLSFILMLIFATGKFPPLLGAIVQEGVDIIVIFNALRAHSGRLDFDLAIKSQ